MFLAKKLQHLWAVKKGFRNYKEEIGPMVMVWYEHYSHKANKKNNVTNTIPIHVDFSFMNIIPIHIFFLQGLKI